MNFFKYFSSKSDIVPPYTSYEVIKGYPFLLQIERLTMTDYLVSATNLGEILDCEDIESQLSKVFSLTYDSPYIAKDIDLKKYIQVELLEDFREVYA